MSVPGRGTPDGPHKSSSILPLTGILFKDDLALVHRPSLQCAPVTRMGTTKPPQWHNYPATCPAPPVKHKQWEDELERTVTRDATTKTPATQVFDTKSDWLVKESPDSWKTLDYIRIH
ncbi:unnamed protein product [Pleuronectes platessa]|uniref:Uncharacterized protein n=1 Tax=Pleuronectes platessa TaxID=8262 RepID=A0A9N7Y1Y3_PLEPL|nr:unnamed protein product [Pleuronectes platessa]